MSLIERLLALGPVRKAMWQLWYPYLTKRLQRDDVVFLNYAYVEEPPQDMPLSPEDEPNRACIQLYHHLASQVPLEGLKVLEVSCGHGGGASWITRTFRPASYTGLDLNPAGIAFCKQRHQVARLTFQQGDAQRLPFPDGTFDVLINVEASHCYPDFPGFLAEAARVLKPGGHMLYTDFRFRDLYESWIKDIQEGPFQIMSERSINEEVLRGMAHNARRNLDLVSNRLPSFLGSLGRDFAGVPGARVHKALEEGELSYRSWCLRTSS